MERRGIVSALKCLAFDHRGDAGYDKRRRTRDLPHCVQERNLAGVRREQRGGDVGQSNFILLVDHGVCPRLPLTAPRPSSLAYCCDRLKSIFKGEIANVADVVFQCYPLPSRSRFPDYGLWSLSAWSSS